MGAQPRNRRLGHLDHPHLVPSRAGQVDLEPAGELRDQRGAGDDAAQFEAPRRAHVDLGVDTGKHLSSGHADPVATQRAVALPG
jgi:hypothetical protein